MALGEKVSRSHKEAFLDLLEHIPYDAQVAAAPKYSQKSLYLYGPYQLIQVLVVCDLNLWNRSEGEW